MRSLKAAFCCIHYEPVAVQVRVWRARVDEHATEELQEAGRALCPQKEDSTNDEHNFGGGESRGVGSGGGVNPVERQVG